MADVQSFTPLKIVEIEDSGNNGIVYKALEYGHTRALKVSYSFTLDASSLIQKTRREFLITKDLDGITGVPRVYSLFTGKKNGDYEFFSCDGFDMQKTKGQIFKTRDSFQSDSESDLLLAGAFTMDFMDIFSKLPKEVSSLPYALPKTFFDQLYIVAEEILRRGYSLPPESDIGFDKAFQPIVFDFAGSHSVDELVRSGKSKRFATQFIKTYNDLKISSLREYYQEK